MRNILNIILVSYFISIISGCDPGTVIKEDIEYIDKPHLPCISQPAPIYLPGEMLYGRVSGLKNCLPFMASARLSFFNYNGHLGTDLGMTTYEDWGNHFFVTKENILVGALALNEGTYGMFIELANGYEAGYTTTQDMDVAEDVFKMDSLYNMNEITFSKLDRTIGHAQGFFNCRFLIATTIPSGHNPDTVVFTDCYFDAWTK